MMMDLQKDFQRKGSKIVKRKINLLILLKYYVKTCRMLQGDILLELNELLFTYSSTLSLFSLPDGEDQWGTPANPTKKNALRWH